MTLSRGIPLSAHGAIEVIAGPAIMAAPFVLGFGAVATVLTIVLGALVLTMSLQLEHPGRALPLSAHAGFDYALAFTALFAGLGFAVTGHGARISLSGRYRCRPGGADRFNAVQLARGTQHAGLPPIDKKSRHISLLPVPEKAPQRLRGLLFDLTEPDTSGS